jgi:hypothetical protein
MQSRLKRFWILVLTILGLSIAGLYAQAQKLAPVPIEVPKPGYEGTPVNFSKIPNLEKAAFKRGPFLAPPGVKNVALNKKITGSDMEPVMGDLAMITDGDTTQVDDNYVELGPGTQWVQIDLASPQEIYGVLIWHYYQPRVYFCTVVQTADDASFTKNVQTWFNNDTNNKLKLGAGQNQNYVESNEGKLIDTKGVRARYLRLYSAGNNSNELNHYIEVAVYGRPPAK